MQRILGLDVGNKTIGVAVSDPFGWTAQGVTVIRRRGMDHDLDQLMKLLTDYAATEVVVGLPLNMNGSKGPQAMVAEELGAALQAKGIIVYYIDERLSSAAATKSLLAGNASRRKRKEVIDMLAAQLILEVYLGRLRADNQV